MRPGAIAGMVVGVVALGGCAVVTSGLSGGGGTAHASAADVAAVSGWTKIATTPSYLVVVNVLPGEDMYTQVEVDKLHPLIGELALDGVSNPVEPNSRHVEAHVYDIATGLPLAGVSPTIVLLNRTTGERVVVPPTLMQDVNIGGRDVHYGNNVVVQGQSDVSVSVTIGDEEVSVDGHLD